MPLGRVGGRASGGSVPAKGRTGALAFDLPWTLMTSVLERHGGAHREEWDFKGPQKSIFGVSGLITNANVCFSKWVAGICVSLGSQSVQVFFCESRKMCSFLPHSPS